MLRTNLLIAASAIVLGAVFAATPAAAQSSCDVNGTNGGLNANPANGFAFPSGVASFSCGPGSASNGTSSVAIGGGFALANESIAIGSDANINSLAIAGLTIGANTMINQPGGGLPYSPPPAGDLGSITLGGYTGVSGNNSLAIGTAATVGVGGFAGTDVDGGIAIGTRATVQANDAVALGDQATATHANSVALGANTATTATNQVHVGGRTVSGVAAGAVTAVSTDAVNGSQLFATNANVTALQTSDTAQNTAITAIQTVNTTQATQITALQAADVGLDTRIDALEAVALGFDEDLDRIDDRASAGTAAAVALSGAMFLPGKSFNLTGNVGSYRGAHAAAIQFGALVSDNVAINAGIGHGFNKGGKTAFRAGFTFGW